LPYLSAPKKIFLSTEFKAELPTVSAKAEVLNVQLRDQTGTAAAIRLRRSGMVPAVLYGHGEANRHLAIPKTEIQNMLRRHSKTVSLQGAVSDTALLSDVQFDHLGINVLHLDLIRVNLKDTVEVEVPISLHGDAVGTRSGGILLENAHSVLIRCPAGSIPDSLVLEVGDLDVGGQKVAGDLRLPEGVELVTSRDTVITHIEKPRGAAADDAGGEAAAEA
jgi:large subunit ribosomal protein L25